MKLDDAKLRFIEAWGTLGSSWGVTRTMAQIHAYLILAPVPKSTEEIMEDLKISRGNANMNTRQLIDWGIVQKSLVAGDRKEYFVAKKDVWEMARAISRQRRSKELAPILQTLTELKKVEGDKKDPEMKEFLESINNIDEFAVKVDDMLDKFSRSDEHWFYKNLIKIMK